MQSYHDRNLSHITQEPQGCWHDIGIDIFIDRVGGRYQYQYCTNNLEVLKSETQN